MKRISDNQGFGILSVLIWVMILSMVHAGLAASVNISLRGTRQISGRAEVEDLRNYIRNGMDCFETMASNPGPCPAGRVELFPALTASPPVVLDPGSGTTTSIGRYQLRAECTGNATKTFNVEYRSGGQPWRSLFVKVPLVCS